MGEAERQGTFESKYPGAPGGSNPYGSSPYSPGDYNIRTGGSPSAPTSPAQPITNTAVKPFSTAGVNKLPAPTRGFDYNSLTKQYQDLANMTNQTTNQIIAGDNRSGGQVSMTTQRPEDTSSWRYGSPGDVRRLEGGGGGGAIRAGTTAPAIPAPVYNPLEAPTMPEYKRDEYAPPEEDKGIYDAERRKAMGAGTRELRQRTQESMLASRSLNNPQARKDFVRSALEGFGSGLEKIARGAGREATAIAGKKRSEQLKIYDSQYSNRTETDKVNYQNEINTIASNFAQQQFKAQQEYGTQKDAYLNQPQANITSGAIPGGEEMSAAARARQQFYGGNQPNMGYM